MLTLKIISKEDFNDFSSKQENNHYMQSLSWGEYSKTIKHLTPYYLGLIDEQNNIICATLLLQDYIKFNYSYFYSPYGFIINYTNKDLVKEMTKQTVNFIKEKKGLFFKINPNIIESKEVIDNLKEIGYKYQNTIQKPIYTTNINNKESKDNSNIVIDSSLGTKEDLKELKYSSKYQTLYDIFNGNTNTEALIFINKLNFSKTIKSLEDKLKKINNQISILPIDNLSKLAKEKLASLTKEKNSINEEIKIYKEYKNEYSPSTIISSQLMLIYNDTAWVIETTIHNSIPNISIDNYIYNEHINYCKEHKIKVYNNYNKLEDMHELKYIGEFTYIINKPLYLLLKCKNKEVDYV